MYFPYPRHTHLTCHPFEPSAQPRWDSRRRIGPTGGGQCPSTPHSREIGQGSSPHAHPSATRSTPPHTRHRKSVNAQPHAPSPFPGTNGAIHPSLGYSPRKRDIETIQGLTARHHPVDSWGRDMSGLQPFGSIIMADTQAVGPPRCLLSNAFAPCKPNLLRARTTTGISPESDATTLS